MGTEITVAIPKNAVKLPDNARYTHRFEIKSQSSNRVYVVSMEKSTGKWCCSCPGWIIHQNCKHLKSMNLLHRIGDK